MLNFDMYIFLQLICLRVWLHVLFLTTPYPFIMNLTDLGVNTPVHESKGQSAVLARCRGSEGLMGGWGVHLQVGVLIGEDASMLDLPLATISDLSLMIDNLKCNLFFMVSLQNNFIRKTEKLFRHWVTFLYTSSFHFYLFICRKFSQLFWRNENRHKIDAELVLVYHPQIH